MRFLVPLCLFIFLVACESTQEEADKLQYELVLVDSIQFDGDYEMPKVVATHPRTGDLMIMANQGEENHVAIISTDGVSKILFNHPKEGPESVGTGILSGTFFRDGFALLGQGVIGIYDSQFAITQRIEIPLSVPMVNYFHTRNLQTIEKDGMEQLLFHFSPHGSYTINDPEFYQNYNPLTLLNVDEESFQPYGGLHEESVYRQGRTKMILRPYFSVQGQETRLVYDSDNVSYIFDGYGNEINRTKTPFEKFVHFVAKEEDIPKEPYAAGRIFGYFHHQGIDIWEYSPGLTVAERANMPESGTNPNQRRILLSKNGEPLGDTFQLPERVFLLGLVDKDGFIWAPQNVYALEEEPERNTLYKLEIQTK